MEKNEPSLIPEWLKNSGSSASARSDDRDPSGLTRNRSSVNNTGTSNNNSNNHNSGNTNGRDLWRSFRSDRTASSRRGSNSKGSDNLRSQSSSGGRNHHDKEWSSGRYESNSKEKSFLGECWHRDSPGSLKSTSSTKLDRDGLRRSQSMISGRRGDAWHRKAADDSDYYGGKSKNGSPTKTSSPIGGPKMNFARDFPSLGSEERAAALDVTRVPSPGFSSSIKSLPAGITSNVGNEKWKSALAEVPGLVGGNGINASSQHVALRTNTGLNMAEAVAQGPIHAQSSPQLSVGTQKSEELSLKLSKQLIPVTPSLPKSLTKAGQQQHLVLANSPRGGPVKIEVPKAKLHILKPAREKNGVAPISKDKLSPTGSNKPVTPTLAPCSSSVLTSSPFQSPPNSSIIDPKPTMTVLEKRPTSQARSRKDFFNSVRKKSMENSILFPSTANSLPVSEPTSTAAESPSLPDESIATLNMGPGVDHVSEAKVELNCNGDANEHLNNGNEQYTSDLSVPDEAEAALLRSMGWEEDSDEGGLTEEEIKAFFRDAAKYTDSKPTLKALQRSTTGNAF